MNEYNTSNRNNIQQSTPPPLYGNSYAGGGWIATPPQAQNPYNRVPEPPVIPQKPKSNSARKAVAVVALALACAVSGFGGGFAAYSAFSQGDNQVVVYKAPENNTGAAGALSSGEGMPLSEVANIAGQSVVSIVTENMVSNPFTGGRVESGAGSGVIISEDGYIMTNNHVVDGANKISVTLPDGSEHEATLVGKDAVSDVAVVKVNVKGLVPAVLGNSDALQVGEMCLAIGNPLGTLGGTVTDGIISALHREIQIDNSTMDLLQISAAVNPGNSGGGLFNAQGELVGVVNAKSGQAEGLGFAIPVNTAIDVAQQLIENGRVTGRPALGISAAYVASDEQAAEAGLSSGAGVYVSEVLAGSGAEAAGLQVGDEIVRVNGEEIGELADISAALAQSKVGESAEVTVLRAGSEMTLQVVLMEKSA